MRFALKEVLRRPGRFVAAAMILMLVSLLIVYLGGVIDGTVRAGTGALRAQPTQLLVFSTEAKQSIPDSRIDAELRRRVTAVPGVTTVGGLGISQLAARLTGPTSSNLVDAAVIGYELASRRVPAPPKTGEAYADVSWRASGVRVGSVILVGPARSPLTVVGFVSDTTFDGQATLWTPLSGWRTIQTANRPARSPGSDGTQVLAVSGSGSTSALATRIDAATGSTETVTPTAAVAGLPGVEGTRSVFTAVIIFTTVIGIVVIALLFALLVVERTGLFGVLKALGVRSRQLFFALAVQAVLIATLAAIVGSAGGWLLGSLATSGVSAAVFTSSRLVASGLLVIGAAVFGATITLRRVLAIDPAAAIGSPL
jgi:putative ABC transport system permease protein